MAYANCPKCGHVLVQSDKCVAAKIKCIKCKKAAIVTIEDDKVHVILEDKIKNTEKTQYKKYSLNIIKKY